MDTLGELIIAGVGVVAVCGAFWYIGRVHGYDDGYGDGWVDGNNDR